MRAVVFDLDGTLIDSAPDIHAASARMLAEAGLPPLGFTQIRGFIGNGVPVLVERIMAASGLAPDADLHRDLVASMLRHYEAAPAELTTLYPDAAAAVSQLQAAGFALGICTNKPEAPTREILGIFGLAEAFAAVVGGDTLAERKPHPAPLHAVLEQLGTRTALYVGDSEIDAETAARADVAFALFTKGYRRTPVAEIAPRYAFDAYGKLKAIVARAFASTTPA